MNVEEGSFREAFRNLLSFCPLTSPGFLPRSSKSYGTKPLYPVLLLAISQLYKIIFFTIRETNFSSYRVLFDHFVTAFHLFKPHVIKIEVSMRRLKKKSPWRRKKASRGGPVKRTPGTSPKASTEERAAFEDRFRRTSNDVIFQIHTMHSYTYSSPLSLSFLSHSNSSYYTTLEPHRVRMYVHREQEAKGDHVDGFVQ